MCPNSWTFFPLCFCSRLGNLHSLLSGAQYQKGKSWCFCHEFILRKSGNSGAPGRCRQRTTVLCMCSSLSRARGFPVPSWASLGTEWDKGQLAHKGQRPSRSEVSNPTSKVYTWHRPVKLSVETLWYHPLVTFGNWSTDALNDLIGYQKPTEDLGSAPVSEVSVQRFTVRQMLFSQQFSQGLANLCCNENGLEIRIVFLKVWWQQRGSPAHV